MKQGDTYIKILLFEHGALSFGIFEADVEKILRYRRETMVSLWESPFAKKHALKSFNDYFDIPHADDVDEYFLIKPKKCEDFLVVEGIKRLIRVDEGEVLPTEAGFIKMVRFHDKDIPIFSLPDLLDKDPPLDIHALLVVSQDNLEKEKGDDTVDEKSAAEDRPRKKKRRDEEEPQLIEDMPKEESSDRGNEKKKMQRRCDYHALFSLILSGVSFCVLFSFVYLLSRFDSRDFTRIVDILIFQKEPSTGEKRPYISSYLSQDSREALLKDVYHVLQEKKNELRRIEAEIVRLESQKERFLDSMEEKRNQFKENISSIGMENIDDKLRTSAYLAKHMKQFDREIRERTGLYMASHEKKSKVFASEKQRYQNEIDELTDFVKGVSISRPNDESLSRLFLDETEFDQAQRLLFLIEHKQYDRAMKVLTDLMSIASNRQKRAYYSVLVQLVSVLREYKQSLDTITRELPFDDIKMAYLNENYENALKKVNRIQADGFLNPLLSGLKHGLNRNIESAQEIADELNLKGDIRELFRRAQSLEERGEYEKAMSMYEDLLIFNLPPYDREHIVKKIHEIMGYFERSAMKRADNTRATRYLETAQRLYREGNEEEALDYYRLLIIECPNSDYVENALSEIIKIMVEEKILG